MSSLLTALLGRREGEGRRGSRTSVLEVAWDKTKVVPACQAAQKFSPTDFPGCWWSATSNFKLLGSAIGDWSWCENLLLSSVDEASALLQVLGKYHDVQGAFVLLQTCSGWSKILHSCRTVPPSHKVWPVPTRTSGPPSGALRGRHFLTRIEGSHRWESLLGPQARATAAARIGWGSIAWTRTRCPCGPKWRSWSVLRFSRELDFLMKRLGALGNRCPPQQRGHPLGFSSVLGCPSAPFAHACVGGETKCGDHVLVCVCGEDRTSRHNAVRGE